MTAEHFMTRRKFIERSVGVVLAICAISEMHGGAAERLRADIRGCGVYQTSGYTDERGTLSNPHLDGHKLMVWWSQVEPEEGNYKWSVIEGPMKRWIAAGKRVMLSPVTAHSDRVPTFPAEATPGWVFDAGAKSVPLPLKGGKDSLRMPVYWDPVYLEKYQRFIRALGQRFDAQKGLELVCCGTGTYGETIVSPELFGRKEHAAWEAAGLTPEAWIKAVNTVVDAYVEAFPTTLVGLQVTNPGLAAHRESCTPEYARHAAEKGVLLQYCGATPEPFQWNGQFYVDAIKRWGAVTSLGFEAYSPSSGAAPAGSTFVFKGGLKDIVDVTVKHRINYLVLWHQDTLKATPGHATHDPTWESALQNAATSLKHGPMGRGQSK